MVRIALIGVGEIGSVHLRVLEEIPRVDVVATYDISDHDVTFRGASLKRLQSIADLASLQLDTVIIGTPTDTHCQVIEQVLRATDASVLVEKPMVTTLDELDYVNALDGVERLRVLFHMAMAGEVDWAVQRFPRWVKVHGPLVSFECIFTDPFSIELDAAKRAKTDSWLDSAINALSVLERFVEVIGVERATTPNLVEGHQARVEAVHDNAPIKGHMSTSWDVTDKSKHTRFGFADGTTVVLDHHAVSGHLIVDNLIVDSYTTDRTGRRIVAHYRNLFRLLFEEDMQPFSFAQTERLHRMLITQ